MNYEKEIKKLEEQIKELKAKQELHPVWKPEIEDLYYVADVNAVSQLAWHYDEVDEYYLGIGNLFETEQEAEDYVRSLKLIEMIRRERFKAQGKWYPNEYQARFTISWDRLDNGVGITHSNYSMSALSFGLWKNLDSLRDVIDRYEPELGWYFVDYLPSVN